MDDGAPLKNSKNSKNSSKDDSHKQSTALASRRIAATSIPRRPKSSLQSSLLQEEHPSTKTDDVLRCRTEWTLKNDNHESTEDMLLNDCSLFFRPDEKDVTTPTGGKQKRGFRALRQDEHQHIFAYSDAVDVFAPTFIKQYKARYEQLNQDFSQQADECDNSLFFHSRHWCGCCQQRNRNKSYCQNKTCAPFFLVLQAQWKIVNVFAHGSSEVVHGSRFGSRRFIS